MVKKNLFFFSNIKIFFKIKNFNILGDKIIKLFCEIKFFIILKDI